MKKQRLIILSLFTFLITSSSIFSQSADPPNTKLEVESADHAVLKARALNYIGGAKTEVKLTNMTVGGTGTEMILKLENEEGLSINSNSDLADNTTPDIMTFAPDGDIFIGELAGGGTRPLFVDNNGQIRAGCPSKFQTYSSNVVNFTTTSGAFQAIGTAYTFTKDCDETNLKIRYADRMYYDQTANVGATIQVRVNGNTPDYFSNGSVWDDNNTSSTRLNTWFSLESIYENLPSGTYTIQVYVALTLGGGSATLDPGNFSSNIIVEESH